MNLGNTNTTDHSDKTKNIFSLTERTSADNLAEQIANEFGEVTLEAQFHKNGYSGGVVVCRNCGEVTPDTKIPDTFELDNRDRTAPYQPFVTKQKQTMWTMINLFENDQPRQWMAWALYKIYNVASSFNVDTSFSEGHLAYYDILYTMHL
eukprot:14234364-Ditylum_brightwellii.AAC.1